MGNKLKYFLYNLVTVVVIVGVVEVACRIILNNIYNRDFDSSLITDNKYFTSSGLKENASGKVWRKPFHTDEIGGRKNAKSNPGKKKWLYIGDSVTEGVGIDDNATFSSLISENTDSFQIINLSLIGYSTEDYFNVLNHFASDSTISRVTIFYCLNDIYGKSKTKDLPVMAKQNFAGELNQILQSNYATYKLTKLLMFQNASRYFQYDLQFYNKNDEHFKEAMELLKECDSICKSKNILLSMVMLPYRSQIEGNDIGNRIPQTMVENFCKKDSIRFLDVSNFLSNQENSKSLYLFADEIHFSEKGHRAIADFLLSH